ncbi:MAG: hypothetical protein IK073_05700 [Paludibacteraceae bacterium]|nr:hypothetical protein [Paludibacteraceae bacterium]
MGNEIIVGNWSNWRGLFGTHLAAAKSPRATKRAQYIKPQALIDFENEYNARKAARLSRIPPECRVRTIFRDDTANGLTRAIIAHLQMHGHFASRVNTTGIYDQRRGLWRSTAARRGLADISAVINGRAVQLEIKAGKDKPRSDQMQVQAEVQAAGGIYEFVHNFTEYIELYNRLTAVRII